MLIDEIVIVGLIALEEEVISEKSTIFCKGQYIYGRNKKSMYDGRTKEGRKFVERILARRAAREKVRLSKKDVKKLKALNDT